MGHNVVILVDGEARRRSEIVRLFSRSGWDVEARGSTAELARTWPGDGTFLVQDSADQVKETLDLVRKGGHWRPVVAYSDAPMASQVVSCMRLGAVDYFDINDFLRDASGRVKSIASQSEAMADRHARWLEAKNRLDKLTCREREILEKVVDGGSSREIADQMAISRRTVEVHRANIRGKLDNLNNAAIFRLIHEQKAVSLSGSELQYLWNAL